MKVRYLAVLAAAGLCAIVSPSMVADDQDDHASACRGLPGHGALQSALTQARNEMNGGFNLDMWGTIVNRDGIVCAVAFTGGDRGDQWPGSRVISAQKANTGNAFSLPGLALSTANLFSAVSPGGSLYGLQHSNPVNTHVAYRGNSAHYGAANDPMEGGKIGGINIFGGGFALYNRRGKIVGGLGVSGDSSCADHNIGWKTRHNLVLDYVPGGVSGDPDRPDNIIYDITSQPGQQEGTSVSGFGHPECSPDATAIAAALPEIRIVN